MKQRIDLEEILHTTKFVELSDIEKDLIRCGVIPYNVTEITNAMKEACRQTLELAVENVQHHYVNKDWVGKQSILDTIKQIE